MKIDDFNASDYMIMYKHELERKKYKTSLLRKLGFFFFVLYTTLEAMREKRLKVITINNSI